MVKKGYKQTEIGVIPKDWEVKRLGDIGEPKMCKRIFKNQTKKSGDIPFYKIGTFGKKADAFINKDLYEEYKNKFPYPKKGEILISASGTIGKIVVYNGENAYYQDSNIVWITNNEKLIKNNLLYYYYQVIKWTTENTTISRLYNDILKEIKIPIPPKPEQEKIAKVLSDTDELIENLRELIAKKEDIKKATMQQLLTGKKRLKGFSGEWVERKLGEVAKVQNGYAFKSSLFTKEGVPIIRISNITNNGINLDDSVFYPEIKISKNYIISKNDVLIAMSGATTGKVGIYVNRKKAYLNQRVGKFIPNEKYIRLNYISYFVKSDFFKEQIIEYIVQGAQPNISTKQIESIVIKYPKDITEQKAIAKILSDMDKEIEVLKGKLEKIKAIKQGMMQDLLSGRIRLIGGNNDKT